MKKEHISFEVPAYRPWRPSIYTSSSWLPNEGEYYAMAVPREKVRYLYKPIKEGVLPAFLRVHSRIRPEVIAGYKGIEELVEELARLDARNLSRDNIFEGEALSVTVKQYDFESSRKSGRTLALVSVEFII